MFTAALLIQLFGSLADEEIFDSARRASSRWKGRFPDVCQPIISRGREVGHFDFKSLD